MSSSAYAVAQLKEEVDARNVYAYYLLGCLRTTEGLLSNAEQQLAQLQSQVAALRAQKETEQAALAAARDSYVSACERLTASSEATAEPTPQEAEATAEPPAQEAEAAGAPEAKKEKSTPWRKSTIVLASEEEVSSIIRRIDEGSLLSPTPTVSWRFGTKHHPLSEMPARIIALLALSPERRLSFQALIGGLKLGMNLKDTLQNNLRELQKQGLITTA